MKDPLAIVCEKFETGKLLGFSTEPRQLLLELAPSSRCIPTK
jgi:hypothetical protein